MVFPVVMHRCESWTIDKDEHQRIDAFELRCWRRLLTVPWTARRLSEQQGDWLNSQSILKEINPEYSLEGLALKLKFQYFGHLVRRVGKDLRQEEKGATEDEMDGWYHQLNGHEFEQTPGDSERQGSLACCSPWGHKESDATDRLNSNNNTNDDNHRTPWEHKMVMADSIKCQLPMEESLLSFESSSSGWFCL